MYQLAEGLYQFCCAYNLTFIFYLENLDWSIEILIFRQRIFEISGFIIERCKSHAIRPGSETDIQFACLVRVSLGVVQECLEAGYKVSSDGGRSVILIEEGGAVNLLAGALLGFQDNGRFPSIAPSSSPTIMALSQTISLNTLEKCERHPLVMLSISISVLVPT